MFIRSDYLQRDGIGRKVRYAFEGGLCNNWLTENDPDHGVIHVWERHEGLTPLRLEHIFIAWGFYGLFCLFSCGAFIAEHIVFYYRNRYRGNRFWKLADLLIDGRRNFWLPPEMRMKRMRSIRKHAVNQW